MAQKFDPSAWIDGTTIPFVADYQNIAADLATRGMNMDGGGYARTNTASLTLLPGALPGTTYTITAASWAAGIATITVGAHVIAVNQLITVASVTPAGYNVAFAKVTVATSTTFKFAMVANPGAWVSGGSVLVGTVPGIGTVAIDSNLSPREWNGSSWLTLSSGGFQRCLVYNSVTQAIPDSTVTTLTFDTNIQDNSGFHSVSVNTDQFVIPVTGEYRINAAVAFQQNITGDRFINVYVNANANPSAQCVSPSTKTTAGFTALCVPCRLILNAGDIVRIKVYQNSGGSLNVQPGNAQGLYAIGVERVF